MKVHHLSCATMCPPLGRTFVNESGKMVCHCLLVEGPEGLILVDTGIGVAEHEDPVATLGRQFNGFARLQREPHLAAVRQVERLGFKAADVRHIVITHLDLDHAGGIPDFPGAKVHVHIAELQAARARATFKERSRYRPHQWRDATFVTHEANGQGDAWLGFQAVKPIPGLEVALVPLHGHTRGHCGVAVRGPEKWLFHCGDAYFYAGEMDVDRYRCSGGLRFFQRITAMDNTARVANQLRLRSLARDHLAEVRVFCAHDPREYEALAQGVFA